MERLRGLHRTRRKAGAGMAASVVIHLVAFVVVFIVARNVAQAVIDVPRAVLTFNAPPPPPPPKGGRKKTVKKEITKEIIRPVEMVIPKEVPKEVPAVADEPDVESDEPEIEGGMEGGVEGGVIGGTVGGVLGGVLGGTLPPPDESPDEAMAITIGVTPPVLVRKVAPEYPEPARRAKVEGEVVLKCIIDTKGDVRVDQVLKADKLLEDAAVRSVKRWKYEPAIYKGRPQAVVMILRIKFTIPKK